MFVIHPRNEFIGLEGKDNFDQVETSHTLYDTTQRGNRHWKNALNSNCDKSQRVKNKFNS